MNGSTQRGNPYDAQIDSHTNNGSDPSGGSGYCYTLPYPIRDGMLDYVCPVCGKTWFGIDPQKDTRKIVCVSKRFLFKTRFQAV